MHGSCETLDSSTSKTEKMKKLQKSIIPSNQHLREPAKLEVDPGFEVIEHGRFAKLRYIDFSTSKTWDEGITEIHETQS